MPLHLIYQLLTSIGPMTFSSVDALKSFLHYIRLRYTRLHAHLLFN